MQALRDGLDELCETGDPTGGIQLVAGVSGVGKSQLAWRFANEVDGSKVAGRKVYSLVVGAESLSDPVDLFLAMSGAIGKAKAGRKVAEHDDRVSNVAAKAGVLGGGGVARDIGRHTQGLPGLLRKSQTAGMWRKTALVLAIDELQGVDPAGMTALRTLHAGLEQCPIQVLGFGLQHTQRRLANPPQGDGVSRIPPPILLESLNEDDALDAFRGSFEALGVLSDIPPYAIAELAAASHGFPQHVNGYLTGAAKAIEKHGELHGDALAEALAYGDERRVNYYLDRLNAAQNRKLVLAIAAIMRRTGEERIDYDDAMEVLERAGHHRAELDAVVQHGALTLDRRNALSFGVPSFHAFMQRMLKDKENDVPDRGMQPPK